MIWYRHWLELRRPLTLVLAVVLVSAFFFRGDFQREVGDLRAGQPLRRGLARDFGPLLASLPPAQAVAVAVHAQKAVYLTLLGMLLLGGTGLRSVELQPHSAWLTGGTAAGRSAVYTLSLPLSRARLVVTRAAAGYAAASVFFAVSLAANALVLAVAGYEVPLLPMLMVSLFATVVTLFWSTVLGMLTGILGQTFGLFFTLIVAALTSFVVYRGMGEVATTQRAMVQIVPVLLVVIAGVVYLTTRLVADEEF